MEIPHTHYSAAEHKAANLGASMAAAGFNDDDTPYEENSDLDMAWWRGFSWAHRLVGHVSKK